MTDKEPLEIVIEFEKSDERSDEEILFEASNAEHFKESARQIEETLGVPVRLVFRMEE